MCVWVHVENVRGWDAVCRRTIDACPNNGHCLSCLRYAHVHMHTCMPALTHTGLWHIPEADQSIVQALQWAIAFTYIKMSTGYRAASEDHLLSDQHTQTHVHTHMHTNHTQIPHSIYTSWEAFMFCCEDRKCRESSRPYLRQHSSSFFFFFTKTSLLDGVLKLYSPLGAWMSEFELSQGLKL